MGRVVVLNGSSSAGKSAVARSLQRRWELRGECWLIFSWDDFMPRIPMRWHGGPDEAGDLAESGVSYRLNADQSAGVSALLMPGPVGRQILRGYHRAIAALAQGAGRHSVIHDGAAHRRARNGNRRGPSLCVTC